MSENVQLGISPYKGEEAYIFISYSHRNMKALQIVEQLQSDGYRVWYDEGIDPGTEWDENIAMHVRNCFYFIALLSEDYINSSNCKDELNYARDLGKRRLLIYLQNVQLPAGMQMRLSRLQAIHKYTYDSEKLFMEKLYATRDLYECRTNEFPISSASCPEIIRLPVNQETDVNLILVADTSGSMTGARIEALNIGIAQSAETITEIYGDSVGISLLSYSSSAIWMRNGVPLEAGGTTDLGAALNLLNKFGETTSRTKAYAIIFISDGYSTDQYYDVLESLKKQEWYCSAIKTAIAISTDADIDSLSKLTSSSRAVIIVEDLASLQNILKKLVLISVSACIGNNKNSVTKSGCDVVEEVTGAGTGLSACNTDDVSTQSISETAKAYNISELTNENEARKQIQVEPQNLKKTEDTSDLFQVTLKPQKKKKEKNKSNNQANRQNVYFFGKKKAKKLFSFPLPAEIRIPDKTNIILNEAFTSILLQNTVTVDSIVLPETVRVIDEHAFAQIMICKTINLPSSIQSIGEEAFSLSENAYAICEKGTYAYDYCSKHGIRNPVDVDEWKKHGRCQYCGGKFSWIFKKCKSCGRPIDY